MNLSSQNELCSKKIDAIYLGFVFNVPSANLTDNEWKPIIEASC